MQCELKRSDLRLVGSEREIKFFRPTGASWHRRCLGETSFRGRLIGRMHLIPLPLKVIDQPLYAMNREGIKGHAGEPTVVNDFLV